MSDITFNKSRGSLWVYRHEDGYLRWRRRLEKGKILINMKEPILLAKSHHQSPTDSGHTWKDLS